MQWLLSASPRLDVLVWIARCVLLLGALLFTAFLFQWWRVHRWFQGFHKARHLVSKGRFQEAEEGFRRAAREASGTRHVMALAALGVCRLQQGEYAEAVALMEPLMDEPLPRRMRMDGVALAGYLALSLAMLGETRRARRWLDEAHRRFGGRVSFVVLPEVVILCREGHLGAALSLMNHSWPVLLADGLVTDKMRMFRAYVLSKVDPEREVRFILLTLLSLAPFPKKELAFCREHWPVLADFMEQGQELAARRDAR